MMYFSISRGLNSWKVILFLTGVMSCLLKPENIFPLFYTCTLGFCWLSWHITLLIWTLSLDFMRYWRCDKMYICSYLCIVWNRWISGNRHLLFSIWHKQVQQAFIVHLHIWQKACLWDHSRCEVFFSSIESFMRTVRCLNTECFWSPLSPILL